MKRFFEKYVKQFIFIIIAIVSVALVAAAISLLFQYSDQVAEQSIAKASYNTLLAKREIEDTMKDYETKAIVVADHVADCRSQLEIYQYLSLLSKKYGYSDILLVRYYKDGVIYSYTGDKYDGEDISRAFYESTPHEHGCVGSYSDASTTTGNMIVIGFYAPVEHSEFADGVVVYYTRNKVEQLFASRKKTEDAEYSLLCSADGEILVGQQSVENSELSSVLRGLVGEKGPVDEVMQLMQSGKDGTVMLDASGDDYIVSVAANRATMADLCIAELFKVATLSGSSFAFVDTIIAIFVLFAFVAICLIIYLIIHRIRMRRQLFNLETSDKQLNCLNRHGFEKEVQKILERNRNSYFGIIVCQLRHYKYINETFGDAETERLLTYLRLVCSKTTGLEEVYGHVANGEFLLFLHAKDRNALIDRMKNHAALCTRYKGANTYDVHMKYGIYEPDAQDNVPVSQMIDFANEANNAIVKATVENATMQFNFYSNELRRIRLINEDMELRMEGALKNGEFQVFYQPKYNLNHGRQDGAEALVRWYDPKTKEYNRPGLFMPLFETNGFIVKLDKYVYSKVCEYISYSIAQGRTVFPISVNVSRITAVQPDFITYYSQVKRKYGISDGQIMIEFTEGFAYESYETLNAITAELHKNGFKCSIDDFGSGYSSYRILKSLPMDEIKLDKFFIEKDLSEERDTHIIKSIIDLAKNLGMKVTQEGVETYEDVERLQKLGCDVIQGYYYSHPIPLTDYLNFVATTRDHNIRKPNN